MATTPIQQSAVDWFKQLLTSWGIAELVPDATKLVLQGLNADAITLQLQQTTAYRQRFAANEPRLKKGLPVLSPAEYISSEAAYQQVLRQYGMPKGFYDQRSDFTNWIANDVAPTELAQRAQDAAKTFLTGPEENRQAWFSYYGGSGPDAIQHAIATILDPGQALPLVEQRLTAAAIGGGAQAAGLSTDRAAAERLASFGVTGEQAVAGYSQIAADLPVEQQIAGRFGTGITQAEEEAAVFLGGPGERQKKKTLAESEAGLFQRSAAASQTALSRPTAGQY